MKLTVSYMEFSFQVTVYLTWKWFEFLIFLYLIFIGLSGYLYFSNNLRHKRPHVGVIIICKIIFAIKSNSFQRKQELTVKSSLLFVIEAVFISEQIKECRFGALLEISDKSSFKLNTFSYMIWQCLVNSLFRKFHNQAVRL